MGEKNGKRGESFLEGRARAGLQVSQEIGRSPRHMAECWLQPSELSTDENGLGPGCVEPF